MAVACFDAYAQQDTQTPVVVFGAERLSQLAAYVLTHDSPFQVIGHTVDTPYLARAQADPALGGLPVFDFATLASQLGPSECQLLIPLGYRHINGLRQTKFDQARARGYRMVSYVSSSATVWPDLVIGENVMVYEQSVIQPFSHIGDNCQIRSSVHLSHHTHLKDHVFVAAGVVCGGGVSVGARSVLGLGATVKDGLTLADQTFVGAGALLLTDTAFNGLYVGQPAKRQVKAASEV